MLRAAVLGANDGLLFTAALVLGVARVNGTQALNIGILLAYGGVTAEFNAHCS